MSEHTETPWLVVPGKTFIYALDENGVNRFQASIGGAHCPDDELVANARHIVHCVNNHERLVEALRHSLEFVEMHSNRYDGFSTEHPQTLAEEARTLLAELENQQ